MEKEKQTMLTSTLRQPIYFAFIKDPQNPKNTMATPLKNKQDFSRLYDDFKDYSNYIIINFTAIAEHVIDRIKTKKQEYLAAEVCKITDLNQNQLTAWLTRGFIKPSVPADGSGTRNIFSVEDIFRIELFKQLKSSGFNLSGAAGVAFIDDSSYSGKYLIEAISHSIKEVEAYK